MIEHREIDDIDLAHFDDDYVATPNKPDMDLLGLPDGTYKMVVERVEIQRSQKGNRMLVWRLRVLGPRYAGSPHWHRNMIVTNENMRWLKRDLNAVGVHLDRLSDLPDRLDEFIGLTLEVQMKRKGDAQNSHFKNRIRLHEEEDVHASKDATKRDRTF